ncbi:MAG TPA: hypothetical protein VII63_12580 [Caulobacteraceae bacterium]
MPTLEDPRQEAFARALARGLSVRNAAKEAGYFDSITRGGRRAKRPKIAARIEELVELATWGGDLKLAVVFKELMRLAKAAAKLQTGAGMAAARGMLAEAAQVRAQAAAAPSITPAIAGAGPVPPPTLTKEEWIEAFAPKS